MKPEYVPVVPGGVEVRENENEESLRVRERVTCRDSVLILIESEDTVLGGYGDLSDGKLPHGNPVRGWDVSESTTVTLPRSRFLRRHPGIVWNLLSDPQTLVPLIVYV